MIWWQKLLLLIGIPVLYRLGGMGFHKLPRRMGIPILLLAVKNKKLKLKDIIAIFLTAGAFCLGYGENHKWWERILVACAFSLPTLLIKFSWLVVLPPATFIITWILSNSKKVGLKWEVCEVLTGLSIAILWINIW